MTEVSGSPETAPIASGVLPESEKGDVTLVYILQAVGFFFGVTFLAAVIVNYVKKDDVRSEIARSHFRWQIRTFWFSALWCVVGTVLAFVVVGYFIILANVCWTLYRVIRGWLRLNDGKPAYPV